MKPKSLLEIADFYRKLGYRGTRLREAIQQDEDYQDILKKRAIELKNKFKITPDEKKRYVLSLDDDYEILAKCKQLEKMNLTKEDTEFIEFIKTQLEFDYRKGMIDRVNQLLKKYGK
ncbi:MAG: hypothetical protein KKB03_00630 [Nanoarchaeota archaeon]|nr:hypothetical protein [Nanoarchaeota archaeon]MBU1135578.1 hypothetical protein [Nanoarchaeota archaeon]MBU2519734.1 hypothetical protein [Nanoarchaeota archaeon]